MGDPGVVDQRVQAAITHRRRQGRDRFVGGDVADEGLHAVAFPGGLKLFLYNGKLRGVVVDQDQAAFLVPE